METYYYPADTSGKAAAHLLDHSALKDCTERAETYWAGADAVKVRTRWALSTGEVLLFQALDMFARGGGLIDLARCAEVLDDDNRRVLHEAIGIGFGLVEVAA